MATFVTLVSSDERKTEISIEASKLSTLLVDALNLDETIPDGPKEVPILNVDGETLEKIVNFLEYYAKNPFKFEKENDELYLIEEKFEDVSFMVKWI
jgi:Skp1 family, tetramerisation domain